MFAKFTNAMQNTCNQVNNNTQMVEQFGRYRPPTQNGRNDPAVIEECFRSLEYTFTLIGCTNAHRVTCVAYQLVEDANHWWEGYWRLKPAEERDAFIWNDFKKNMMEKHYPQSHCDQMEAEFLEFRQGGVSIADYEIKFN